MRRARSSRCAAPMIRPPRAATRPDGRKVQATLHWVAAADAVPAEVRLYSHLFNRPDPGADGDVLADLNPDSLEVLTGCLVEPALLDAPVGEAVQFERTGYFAPRPGLARRTGRYSTAPSGCATPGRKKRPRPNHPDCRRRPITRQKGRVLEDHRGRASRAQPGQLHAGHIRHRRGPIWPIRSARDAFARRAWSNDPQLRSPNEATPIVGSSSRPGRFPQPATAPLQPGPNHLGRPLKITLRSWRLLRFDP